MSREYAEERIREALKQTRGNPARARQRVIAWAFEDARLLHALTRPHMTGIVAHAVNRVISKKGLQEEKVPETPEALDMAPETFGKEILNALQSGNTPMFGQENYAPRQGRKGASQSHIDAIRKLTGKGKSGQS